MSGGVGVLSSEHRSNAEDTLSSTSNLELLVELRRLGKESLLAKVCQSEDIGTTLRCCTNQAWWLEFLEPALLEVRAEEPLHLNTDILRLVSQLSRNLAAGKEPVIGYDCNIQQ